MFSLITLSTNIRIFRPYRYQHVSLKVTKCIFLFHTWARKLHHPCISRCVYTFIYDSIVCRRSFTFGRKNVLGIIFIQICLSNWQRKTWKIILFSYFVIIYHQIIIISFINISRINSEFTIFEKLDSKMNYVVLCIMSFSDKNMKFLDILQP